MNKIGKLVLVTGTPGVGKTTVAQKLASELDAECIGITELVKNENMITGKDRSRTTLIADTEKVSKTLKKILNDTQENNIIVEGHYAVHVVNKKDVDTVFVLRRDPNELKATLEKRGYTEKKVWENLAAEILDVCLYDALSVCGIEKVCEIDVTDKTSDTVVKEMIQVLEKKQEPRVGIVDWLEELEKKGQLEKFLKNF